MKRIWKLYAACLAVSAMLLFSSIMASAAGGTTVKVTGKFGQTNARTMLDMINEFRTGDDAWYPDANGQEVRNTLQPMTYDYGLEQAAMQRAIETALSFSATRPNGENNKTVLPNYSVGENFAAGASAAAVFKAWKADGKPYTSQVSRRNMLNRYIKTVGVGHVFYNGKHYWVMMFGTKSSGVPASAPLDGDKTMEVEVALDKIAEKSLNVSSAQLEIPLGSSVPLPEIAGGIRLESANPSVLSEVSVVCDWKAASGGDSIISISSGTVSGTNAGTTSITTEVFGETFSVPVTVSGTEPTTPTAPKSISSATVFLATDAYTYNGKARKPAVLSVVLEGKELTAGKDYTVSYTNNVNPGTATVTVAGIGDYTGSVSEYFTIKEKIKKIAVGVQGKASGAKYKVTKGGVSGKAEVEYVAPVNAAKASVVIPSTVTLKGFKCKVTSIAANAFKNNKKLKNVTIPASVGKIGKQAFYNCRNLAKLEIRTKTLTTKNVGANAFGGVSGKVTIKVPAGKRNAYKKLLKARGLCEIKKRQKYKKFFE